MGYRKPTEPFHMVLRNRKPRLEKECATEAVKKSTVYLRIKGGSNPKIERVRRKGRLTLVDKSRSLATSTVSTEATLEKRSAPENKDPPKVQIKQEEDSDCSTTRGT